MPQGGQGGRKFVTCCRGTEHLRYNTACSLMESCNQQVVHTMMNIRTIAEKSSMIASQISELMSTIFDGFPSHLIRPRLLR
eukprot:760055-Hanusia_phi.AAC.3